MNELKVKGKPFIKWVGGKGQLLPQLENALPEKLYTEEFIYIEPFVGGGAMLFFMLQHFPNIKHVVINDINSNLTKAYQIIKENPDELVEKLKSVEKEYFSIVSEEARKDFYLQMRERFNEERLDKVSNTTLLLFLNRTCFNGLYRENSKGKFNVPFGRYANPTICNEELIFADSELLNRFNVEIMNGDFEKTFLKIDKNRLNFFYFDPPYRPISTTSSFNTYVKETFGDDEQRRLANYCRQIAEKENCLWMLSNSDCSAKNLEDTFLETIYNDYYISRVYASRSINANPTKRGKLTELLICNYAPNNHVMFAAEGKAPYNQTI